MPALPRLTSLALVLSLSGCATLETGADHVRDFAHKHPVVTGVATAVVIGGAVVALDHHHYDHAPTSARQSPCAPLPLSECPQ